MLDVNDPHWATLRGGYGVYDARPALDRLRRQWTDAGAWDELWSELHHQGDIGEASYAAVIALVDIAPTSMDDDWNLYALAVTIETERHRKSNPALPDWLARSYRAAWERLVTLALRDLTGSADPLLVRSALAVVALGRGATELGVLLGYLDESEIDELLEDRLTWSELYEPRPA